MVAEEELYDRLDTVPELGNRIYPLVAPQDVAKPYATYRRESVDRTRTFGRTSRLKMSRFVVRVYADSRLGYDQFIGTVNRAQDALAGPSAVLHQSFIGNEVEDFDNDTQQYIREFEMDLAYTQAVTP